MLKEIIVKEIPKFNKKLKNTENIVHHQITGVSEDIYSSPQQELNILKTVLKISTSHSDHDGGMSHKQDKQKENHLGIL